MKALMPGFWMAAVMSASCAYADEGIDAYRLGQYNKAAKALGNPLKASPVVDYYLAKMRLYGYGELKNDTVAIRYLKAAAEKNFLPAQQLLARYELLKNHQYAQALVWFKKAADANDVDAQMYCAAAYLYGLGVSKNTDTAKRYYIAAARNGNPIAQFTLADSFINSREASNKKLGLIWLGKAAEKQYAPAEVLLAKLYIEGKLVPQDVEKAKTLLNDAMAKNDPSAFYQMGLLEQAQNHPDEALKYYTKAATPEAILQSATLYLDEKSPLHNVNAGFAATLKAAELGSPDAALKVSEMYKKGVGVEANEAFAQLWQQKASTLAKPVHENAEYAAVSWLTHGQEKTFDKTVYALPGILGQWQNARATQQYNYNAYPVMELLARETLFQPQFTLTEPTQIPLHEYHDMLVKFMHNAPTKTYDLPRYSLYSLAKNDGHAPELVTHEALQQMAASSADAKAYQARFKQLEAQAILGNSAAQFDIALMYQYGIGVEKNLKEALKYYQLAAAQQDLQAEYNLGLMYLFGTDITPDYTLAIDWLTDAAFKGNDHAQYALARIYDEGYRDGTNQVVIQPDAEKAMAMYNLASANYFGPAEYRLAEILVRQPHEGMSLDALNKQNQLIKGLYAGAVAANVEAAKLPLAFYDAMSPDKHKQQLAFNAAESAAKAGQKEAALLLGLMYDRGIAVEADQKAALKWYDEASDNPLGAFILGTYLAKGIGGSRDLEKSAALLQQAANKGFSYAYLNLAIIKHEQNKDFLPDLNQALSLGNNVAGLLLADSYLKEFNDNEQLKTARAIYQQFAEKGDKKAQLKLGFLAEHGIGGAVNLNDAQHWYLASAEQQQPEAQYLLARLYQLGQPDQLPDYTEAKKWYAVAQTQYPPAAVALGFIYDTVDENYLHAREDYQRALAQGDIIAAYNLGLLYERGEGAPADLDKAMELYLQAAEKGHTQAMVQLAGIYLTGQGKLNDVDEAVDWYKKAADKGSRDAMYQLGLMSETGVGTRLDYAAAARYYQQAADYGDAKAMLALARLYQNGIGVAKNIEAANKLYTTLSDQGNPYAQYQLAAFCFKGIVSCQPEQGKQWLLKAQANGSVEATQFLQRFNAQAQLQSSVIEPVRLTSTYGSEQPSAELMYLDALNAWNLGDEITSKAILTHLLAQFPNNSLAKETYQQLERAMPPVQAVPVSSKNTASLR